MSKSVSDQVPNLKNMAFEFVVDSPLEIKIEGSTGELVVSCFQGLSGTTEALKMNLRFTNSAFGSIASGIKNMLDQGLITLSTDSKSQNVQ